MAIPNIQMKSLVQPVSTMLRNSLLATGPLLKDLDFTHLQMRIPPLTDSETQVRAQVLVKPGSDTHYKLESNQVFVYTRISADEALKGLNFEDRTLPKSDYPQVVKFLEDMGTFNVIKGDINNPNGDAVITFNFGTGTDFASRYITLGSDKQVFDEYGLAFYGTVVFTFVGNPVLDDTTAEEDNKEEDNVLDISPYFAVFDLGTLQDHLLR